MHDDLKTLMTRWQDAMRRRDKLQDLRDGLVNVRNGGVNLQMATVDDVEEALRRANAEVEQLQAAVLDVARDNP